MKEKRDIDNKGKEIMTIYILWAISKAAARDIRFILQMVIDGKGRLYVA
jgi:hypothetical protein